MIWWVLLGLIALVFVSFVIEMHLVMQQAERPVEDSTSDDVF